jgi:hypothetical protein
MDAFDIYVDSSPSGRVMAHLLEPPGLGMRFESRAAMRARLPRAIAAHLAWLRSHGEPDPPVRPDRFQIASEVFVTGNFESGDDVGFYPPDAIPVTEDEVDRYLKFAGFAHDDLLRLVHGLSDAVLDWTRDQRVRPIRQILRHVVGAEFWYMTRIIDDPGMHGMPGILDEVNRHIDASEDMVKGLRLVWPTFQQWARSLPPDLRRRVTVPAWFTERKDERWSARKMLRRCIEHCREHTRTVEQILAAYRSTASPTS